MHEGFEACLQSVITDGLSPYFAYDPPNGRIDFRRSIVEYLAQQGPMTAPEDVIVTSGAQQAIELVVRLLVPHGSPVIVERPSYYGVINALRSVGARILKCRSNLTAWTSKSSKRIWRATGRA